MHAVVMASVRRLRASAVQVSLGVVLVLVVVGCLVVEMALERTGSGARASLDGQVWIAHEVSGTRTHTRTHTHTHTHTPSCTHAHTHTTHTLGMHVQNSTLFPCRSMVS